MNACAPEQPSARLLRGKYRLLRLIGEGGMGRVYEALHVDLDRRVAIKLLHAELRENADLVERFVREGRAASKIDCEHVAAVLDVDRVEDGTPFIVMEYLDGQDLAFVRRTKSPLPIQEAVDYVLQTCVAIGQAHARGVIHRDLKPANLFLAKLGDGTRKIKVLDFGISKMADALGTSQPSITRTTMIMGSVEYMSPEQMLSTRDVDGRTDLWALGVVLYELLTAAVPFTGETVTQVCAHVMSQPPIRPTSLRADLPASLEEFLLRALEKDRTRRFATAEDFACALRATVPLTHVGLGPVTVPTPERDRASAPLRDARTSDPPQPAESRTSSVPSRTGPLPDGAGAPAAASSTVVLPLSSTGRELSPGAAPADGASDGQTRLSRSSPPQVRGSASPQIPITTHVGVASDPIPQPPRRSGAAPVIVGAVLLAGLAALGLPLLLRGESTEGAGLGAGPAPAHSSGELGDARASQIAPPRAASAEEPPSVAAIGDPPPPAVAPVRPAEAPLPPAGPSAASSASSAPNSAPDKATSPRAPPPKAPPPKAAPPRQSTPTPSAKTSRPPSGID